MIVLDASAAVELLLRTPTGDRVLATLLDCNEPIHAPELLDIEVLHVFRRAVARGAMTKTRAEQAIAILASMPCQRHGHGVLRSRVWRLRHNLSAYDAAYVALAEALDGTLVTCDRGIAAAPGIQAQVVVVE